MADRPLVSIIFPTRNRVPLLGPSVDSLVSLAKDPTRLEFLFKTDDDDPGSADWVRWARTQFPALQTNFRLFSSPRGRGYHDMHRWVNSLSRIANGEWLIIWNDDAHMATQDWDAALAASQMAPDGWHGVPEVRCLCADTLDVPSTAFFFLRREVVEILRRFSYIPHCDTWVTTLMKMVDSLFSLPAIKVRHHNDHHDQVRAEARPAIDTLEYTVNSPDGTATKLRDALKLQEYIDARKPKR